jgi:hypothetical protein
MLTDQIKIVDWAGNLLFQGHYEDEQVDKVLDANRCDCEEGCSKCDGTGYKGDFHVEFFFQ